MREWHTVTVAFSRNSKSAMGLPTMLLRPSTTARRPATGTLAARSMARQPAGVQGTKHGWPSSMRPAFTGVKPSTSLCGAMAAITAASLMCAGSGSCTSTPLTAPSSLAARTCATSCCWGVSAGRRTTCEVMPHSAQSRSLPAT